MTTAHQPVASGERTLVQWVALIFGIAFLVAAAAGFLVTGLTNMDPDPATAPRALGLFPVNVLHNIVHLAFGVWGPVASRSWSTAKGYCTVAGIIYLVLAFVGYAAPTGLGLVPLGGTDSLLHIVLGAPLAFFGLNARTPPGVVAR